MRCSSVGITLIFFLFARPVCAEEWSHIEYGAANVRSGSIHLQSHEKPELATLYARVDNLVKANPGRPGVFYVNDLDERDTDRVANLLYIYCTEKEYPVKVRSLPGSFASISLPRTDTATLANPEGNFFDSENNPSATLQRLANAARRGLELVTSARIAETLPGLEYHGAGDLYVDPKGNVISKSTSKYLLKPTPASATGASSPFRLGRSCPIVMSFLR